MTIPALEQANTLLCRRGQGLGKRIEKMVSPPGHDASGLDMNELRGDARDDAVGAFDDLAVEIRVRPLDIVEDDAIRT